MFAMYVSSMLNPIECSNLSNSLPAAPTKGIPCSSSFAPGASPMNIIFASGFPFPNTIFLAESFKGHSNSLSIFVFSFSNCSFLFMCCFHCFFFINFLISCLYELLLVYILNFLLFSTDMLFYLNISSGI